MKVKDLIKLLESVEDKEQHFCIFDGVRNVHFDDEELTIEQEKPFLVLLTGELELYK